MALAPGSMTSYNLGPGESPLMMTARQKLALMMAQQGADTSPVQHWTQGLARIANAMIGNYDLYKEDQKEGQDKAATRAALGKILGLNTPEAAPQIMQQSQVPPAQMSPSATSALPQSGIMSDALPMGRPPVQSSPKVIGDEEGVKLGLYDPPAAPGMAPPVQPDAFNARFGAAYGGAPPVAPPAPQAPVQTAQMQPNEMRGGMSPDRRAAYGALLSTKSGAPFAQTLIANEIAKEQNRTRPLTDPRERAKFGIQASDTNPYQVDASGKISAINPQPFSVNVNQQGQSEFERTYGEGTGKRALAVLESADKASGDLQKVQLLRGLLGNIQTGKITPATATMGAWMQSVGLDPKAVGIDPSLPATSEAATSLINRFALSNIGAAEGGIPANNFSEADRDFILRLVPGLKNRPEANEIILTAKEREAALSVERADKWAEARAGGMSYEKFERTWRKELQGKNIYGDLVEKARALAGPQQTSDGWTTLPNGVRIREKK